MLEQNGLAGAAGSDNRRDLTRGEIERDAVEDLLAAEAAAKSRTSIALPAPAAVRIGGSIPGCRLISFRSWLVDRYGVITKVLT